MTSKADLDAIFDKIADLGADVGVVSKAGRRGSGWAVASKRHRFTADPSDIARHVMLMLVHHHIHHASYQMEQAQFVFPLLLPIQGALNKDYPQPSEHPYGSHPKQKLDVYVPRSLPDGKKAPIMVFLYGGGFAMGGKRHAPGGECMCGARKRICLGEVVGYSRLMGRSLATPWHRHQCTSAWATFSQRKVRHSSASLESKACPS